MSARKNSAHLFVLFVVLLDSIGVGLVLPVLPSLVQEIGGIGPSPGSFRYGLLMSAYSGALFLSSALIGVLSDRFGRRPVILMTLAGAACDYLVAATAGSWWLLLLARLFAGACGANVVVANAYIADVTAPEKRAQYFGILGAAFGIGLMVGPSIGGLLSEYGVRAPFWAAVVVTSLNLVFGLWVLPESLAPQHRRPLLLRQANPFAALGKFKRFGISIATAGTMVLVQFAATIMQSISIVFSQLQLGWTGRDIGLFLTVAAVAAIVVQGALVRPIVSRAGERPAVLGGIFIMAVGLFAFGFVTTGVQMYAVLLFSQLGYVAGPALQGLISRPVQSEQQGELQGVLSSLSTLAAIFGPLVGTAVFAFFTGEFTPVVLPGAGFMLAGALMLTALGCAMKGLKRDAVTTVASDPAAVASAQLRTESTDR